MLGEKCFHPDCCCGALNLARMRHFYGEKKSSPLQEYLEANGYVDLDHAERAMIYVHTRPLLREFLEPENQDNSVGWLTDQDAFRELCIAQSREHFYRRGYKLVGTYRQNAVNLIERQRRKMMPQLRRNRLVFMEYSPKRFFADTKVRGERRDPDKFDATYGCSVEIFDKIVALVESHGVTSGNTITTQVKVAVFLMFTQKVTQRKIMEQLGIGTAPCTYSFKQVLKAICSASGEYIKQLHPNVVQTNATRQRGSVYNIFENCIGAVGTTHITTTHSGSDPKKCRGRKHMGTLNTMAIATLDGLFQCVVPGLPGSTHDSPMVKDALDAGLFTIPEGKYIIADDGYRLNSQVLSPIKGVPYWRKEVPAVDDTALARMSPDELFNFLHASLRQVTERTFSQLKAAYPIIKEANHFMAEDQPSIIIACMVLFNLTKLHAYPSYAYAEEDRVAWIKDPNPTNYRSSLTPQQELLTSLIRRASARDDLQRIIAA